MSNSFDVSWSQHFGINLAELATEHPCHPIQISNHKRITAQAAKYWERERFLARLGDGVETPEPEPVKTPVKKAKVRRYEFTDKQLEIALRSLNAGGSV